VGYPRCKLMDLPEKVRNKLRSLPDAPGCYMMRDHRGRIIYVGKAASLRKRVQSYFRDASLRSGTPKLRSLVRSVCDLDILVLRNEAEAILTEGRLIKDYRPRFNVSFTDDKRFLLLRADPRDQFPMLKACRIRREDGASYFGPFVSSVATRTTLDFVEKKFGLRKCSPAVPDAETHRHCMNDIVRFCSAPCIGKATKEQYHERFAEACAFLRGQRPAYLQEIRDAMNEAAARMDFEKATALRDTLFALQATVRQNARIASTPEMKEQEGMAAIEQLRSELALPAAPRRIEAYDISNISGTHAVASMVCAINGLPQRSRYRRFRIRTVEGSNDPAMMAEVIRRRFERLLREGGEWPDLIVVDGGATQLQAARQVMERLGVSRVPTAGLAKQFEDLYVSEKGPPLSLPKDSPALKALQRLRDEAHRFALAYHQRLRSRLMRESVLDDIPGIGKTRKKQLLAHFGSVYRLMRARLEEIAGCPHIGEETAQLVFQALHPDGEALPEQEP
jgi:excinuclease ABC subunit C